MHIENETAPEVQGTTEAIAGQVLDFQCKDTKNIEISKIDEAEVGTILRLGDKYFQIVRTPDGNVTTVYREKAELKADGTDFSKVQKYIGSYVEHNFLNYRQSLNRWWNLSHPLKWQAVEGEFPTIRQLFEHIFGEQMELGFDRYQLLLTRPHQIQPILVCVSEQQGTGKSTLLQFDAMLFGSNAIILNVSQYSQQFNALYATKLCIGIDETFINEQFIKERLKQDSTATTIQLRRMRCEHETIPFYGKFTLCTNRETDFARLESNDLRFWVRKVGKIKEFDPNFSDKLKAEIPHFLYFLLHREMYTPKPLSRQWFSKEQLATSALQAVVENSISPLAKTIKEWIEDTKAEVGYREWGFTAKDLAEELKLGKRGTYEVAAALQKELGMTYEMKSYYRWDDFSTPRVGRRYLIAGKTTEDIAKEQQEEVDTPF